MQPPSLPNILVLPGSPGPLLSSIILVSPSITSHRKIEVLEPLDWPPPHSCHPCRVKTPYVVAFLSPLPPPIPIKRASSASLVVSPIVRCAPTILIPLRDTPILVLPTLRKRARYEPLSPALPPAKKRHPANTSMCFLFLSFYFFIIDIFFIAWNLQSLFGLCAGYSFLNLVPALFDQRKFEDLILII